MKKRYIIIAVGIISVLLASLLVNNIILAQTGGEYDPWLDYNEDGVLDVSDLSPLGQSYGSSGDSTKNVNVMNWPVRTSTTVWFNEPLSDPDVLWSAWPPYNASGFGYLHMLMTAGPLSAMEEVTVSVIGLLWNSDHTAWTNLVPYSFVLNSTTPNHAITIPVPSEEFRFQAIPSPGTNCTFFLSFYLTWA